MSVRYRKTQCKIDNSVAFGKWYAKAAILNTVSTEQLCEEIAHSTTVTEADARAMLYELSVVIRQHLLNSERVVLDKLGSFKVGIVSKGVDDEKSVDSNSIKGYRINFTPEYISTKTGVNAKGNATFKRTAALLQGISVQVLDSTKKTAASGSSTSGSGTGTSTGS